MTNANGGEPSFIDRARLLLDEGRAEIQRLDERHETLMRERDAEIASVRSKYADRLAEIADERKTLTRLERALDPSSAKQGRPPKSNVPPERKRTANVSAEVREATLHALGDRLELVSDIAGAIGKSRQSAFNALDQLREEGIVRLAGAQSSGAKVYRLTAQGREAVEATS